MQKFRQIVVRMYLRDQYIRDRACLPVLFELRTEMYRVHEDLSVYTCYYYRHYYVANRTRRVARYDEVYSWCSLCLYYKPNNGDRIVHWSLGKKGQYSSWMISRICAECRPDLYL
jgi:hypothetical protein